MAIEYIPSTGAWVDRGTEDGQLTFWDDTLQKWVVVDASNLIDNFSLTNNYNGTLRLTLHNESTGTAAMASMTVRNDADRRASINMTGSNHSVLPPNSMIIYNEGYGDTGFVVDGNKDFIWFADPLDRHTTASQDHEMMRLCPNGRLKIGRALDTLPIRTVDIAGNVNFDGVEEPDATMSASFTATLAGEGGASVNNGTHYYAVVFVTEDGGETGAYSSSYYPSVTVVDNTIDGAVLLEGIPVSDDPRVVKRHIYRSVANGSLLTTNRKIFTIEDNTTTTFKDTYADAAQDLNTLIYRKANTTASLFYLNDVVYMQATDEFHTSFGFAAGRQNKIGHSWVAIGGYALTNNTSGNNNNALGLNALASNTTGDANNAFGANCLFGNISGSNNIAIGFNCLRNDASQSYSNNIAIGYYSLRNSTAGSNYNCAVGHRAGYNFQGAYNIFFGAETGYISSATAIGNYNIFMGYDVGGASTNGAAENILIGKQLELQSSGGSNQLSIGNMIFGTGINGTGTTVSTGKIGIGVVSPTAFLHLKAGTATVAPLKFTPGTALTTPESGAVEFHNDRLYATNVTTRRALDRSSSTLLTTQTVANTASETVLFSDTVAANGFKTGNMAKIISSGVISSTSAADICTLRIKIGGTTLASVTSPAKVLSTDCFHLSGHATVRSEGATASLAYFLSLDIETNSTEACAITTIDTTTSNTIEVTAQWNSAKVGNTISIYQGILEFKN